MNTRILPALKACLTDGLADLHLLGQTAEGLRPRMAGNPFPASSSCL